MAAVPQRQARRNGFRFDFVADFPRRHDADTRGAFLHTAGDEEHEMRRSNGRANLLDAHEIGAFADAPLPPEAPSARKRRSR